MPGFTAGCRWQPNLTSLKKEHLVPGQVVMLGRRVVGWEEIVPRIVTGAGLLSNIALKQETKVQP